MKRFASFLSMVALVASCSSSNTGSSRSNQSGGTGGEEPQAGAGGSGGGAGATAGKGGSSGAGGATGGTGGTVSAGSGGASAGSGGASAGSGGASAGSGGNGGSGGAMSGGSGGGGAMGGGGSDGGAATGGTGGVVSAKCDYEPKANATSIKLRFEPITLMGVPTMDVAKGGGAKDGVVEIKFIPGRTNEFLLLQKRGHISHMKIEADAKMATLVKAWDLTGVDTTDDCGVISMAFDPAFTTNKLVYFGQCTSPKASRVVRYAWDGTEFTDGVDIMTWQQVAAGPAWHSIGSMGFDPAGNMWVVHGEFTTTAQAQNMNTNLGKLLRFVPSRMAGMGGYTPAADNPYAAEPKPKSAIYAAGLRSPWRAFLNAKGQYFIGDVGDTTNERVLLATTKGLNFGWGGCTGTCASSITSWRGPQDPYDGDGSAVKEARRGRVVWVGMQYGDCGSDRYGGALTGVHLFGDFFAGWFRGMTIDDAGKKLKDVNLGDLSGVSSAAQGADGYIYVTTFGPYDSATTEKPALFRALMQ